MLADGFIGCRNFALQQVRQFGDAVVDLTARFGQKDHRISGTKEVLITEPVLTNGHAPAVHVTHLSDGCFRKDQIGSLNENQQVGFQAGLGTLSGTRAETHLSEHFQRQGRITNGFLQVALKALGDGFFVIHCAFVKHPLDGHLFVVQSSAPAYPGLFHGLAVRGMQEANGAIEFIDQQHEVG